MRLSCHRCGYSDFRLSRFRSSDLINLLFLRYPVRCRVCKLRQHLFILRVLRLPVRQFP